MVWVSIELKMVERGPDVFVQAGRASVERLGGGARLIWDLADGGG